MFVTRIIRFITVSFMLSVTLCAGISATELTVSGQVRARYELDRKSFDGDLSPNEFGLLRTRIGLMGKVNENVSALAQLQDSRLIGGSINGQPTSGTTSDAKNVDLHQGYVLINRLFTGGPGLKVGRFELNLGNERVVGSGNWSNVGRSFEGMGFFYSSEKFKPSLMYLKRFESPSLATTNNEGSLFLLSLQFPKAVTEFVLLADLDNRDASIFKYSERRFHFGLYTKRPLGPFAIESNLALQAGQIVQGVLESDILAYLVAIQMGKTFGPEKKGLFALGVDLASGDDDNTTDRFETYDDLYFTGHKFRGFIDMFDNPGDGGLLDIYMHLLAPLNPAATVKLRTDIHTLFISPNAVSDNSSLGDENYGLEADAVLFVSSIAGAQLELGGSVFLPGNKFDAPDDKPAFWGYGAVTVDF